jgi:hypothetical protein
MRRRQGCGLDTAPAAPPRTSSGSRDICSAERRQLKVSTHFQASLADIPRRLASVRIFIYFQF